MCFIAIDVSKLGSHSLITKTIGGIIEDYHRSVAADPAAAITYPGERVLQTRLQNLANGIPVLKKVWNEIQEL
ncbi:MAG: Ldh family oxidoreductase [Ferruginibacter sp.]